MIQNQEEGTVGEQRAAMCLCAVLTSVGLSRARARACDCATSTGAAAGDGCSLLPEERTINSACAAFVGGYFFFRTTSTTVQEALAELKERTDSKNQRNCSTFYDPTLYCYQL